MSKPFMLLEGLVLKWLLARQAIQRIQQIAKILNNIPLSIMG